jgi:S1-C subfamily serine protease
MRRAAALVWIALAGGCATPASIPASNPASASLLPGTIGVLVRAAEAGVTVSTVAHAGATAGVRVGDVVLRYNGIDVSSERQFYRLVLGSAPGSVAGLELLREGRVERLRVPVLSIDTAPRG